MTTTKKTIVKKTVIKPAAKKPVAKKPVAKKPAAKKPAAKKAPVRKARVAKEPVHFTPVKETLNRTSLVAHIMERMEARDLAVTKKQAAAMIEELGLTMAGSMTKKGSGVFVFPGLFKMTIKDIPAKKMEAIKKGTLVRKPGQADLVPHEGRAAFTKPATRRVKVRPMKNLKDAALQH